MARTEVACRRFAVLSGINQDPANFATCVYPRGAMGAKKGMLAIITEPAGDHPSLGVDSSRIAQEVLVQQYYADNSLSLTSGLLKALDAANAALLRYNYSNEYADPSETGQDGGRVAVQGGNVRTRRAQVGLTAAVLRPDGDGMYLAQMSPTQAYLLHNGILTALPQPRSWHERAGRVAVTLPKVGHVDQHDDEAEEADDEAAVQGMPPAVVPSSPLGSGPGVEVDLLYRRVEPGDILAVVSSSLARYLDRATVETIFESAHPDAITEALYTFAAQRGLAQAHACVLQIGAEATEGVSTDLTTHIGLPAAQTLADNGGIRSALASVEAQPHPAPTSLDLLKKGPKQWLLKRKGNVIEADQEDQRLTAETLLVPQPEAVHENDTDTDNGNGNGNGNGHYAADEAHEDDEEADSTKLPTQVLLQRHLDLPPYRAGQKETAPEAATAQELDFDGWEDVPPSLGAEGADALLRNRSFLHALREAHREDPQELVEAEPTVVRFRPTGSTNHQPRRSFDVPDLFDEEDEEEFQPLGMVAPRPGPRPEPEIIRVAPVKRGLPGLSIPKFQVSDMRSWASKVLTGLLPEKSQEPTEAAGSKRIATTVPVRLAIAGGVLLLVAILAFSVVSVAQGQSHKAVTQYLDQAQQENTLGNQPNGATSERALHLQKALELAQKALTVDPASTEAALLVKNTQASLDSLQGVTRIAPKLLFDLDETDSTSAAGTPSQSAQPPAASTPVSGTVSTAPLPGSIVVQGNDAYVLDPGKSSIYRCRISAHDCTVVLKTGDNAGGQKVGPLLAMTSRVGNLVVLDKNLVSFVFSSDSSAWQAQPLGAVDTLDKPKDIATYDGNLYLLASKPSQISKFRSGQYGEAPDDWIKDTPSLDQMKNPVAMGIDGAIYVLLADGKIVVLEGGKATKTLAPKLTEDTPPTRLFTSPDAQNLYLMRPTSASVTRVSKDGQAVALYKPDAASGIGNLGGMAVDEGSGRLYMLSGRKIYEAALAARNTTTLRAPEAPANGPVVAGSGSGSAPIPADVQSNQPAVRPTAEP